MAPANTQIVTAFEEAGMTPEEISQELGYDLSAVKYALMTGSPKFCDASMTRANEADGEVTIKTINTQPTFDDHDMRMAKSVIKELMETSEVDVVRLRAAVFVIDEAKGRNDLKALQNTGFNVTEVQKVMARAREAMNRTRQQHTIELAPA